MENKKDNSISLSDILRVIKKNLILLAIITLVITAIGAVYTFGIAKKTYKSTADVVVAVTPSTSSTSETVSSTDSLRLTTTVSKIAESNVVLETAAKSILGANATDENVAELTKKLGKEISTSSSTTNYVVTISIVDTDRTKVQLYCQEITNALAHLFETNEGLQKFNANIVNVNPATDASYNSPNKVLYLAVSFLAGLVFALVVIFVKEFLSSKFKTSEEVENFSNVPAIGLFPDQKTKILDKAVLLEPTIKNYEPYNKLFTNIKFSNVDNPHKVIMITSTIEDELKSTVLYNLAGCIKFNEKSVLVIDLDLRKPNAHKSFDLVKENGVGDYFDSDLTLDQMTKETKNGIKVITAGKKIDNPYVVLESQKLKDLIEEAKKKYDYVLIDTPPLTACSDAKTISTLADAVIYNVSINQVNKKIFVESIKQLEDVNANLIGLNIVKIPAGRLNKDYYYYYYNNYYSDEKNNQ